MDGDAEYSIKLVDELDPTEAQLKVLQQTGEFLYPEDGPKCDRWMRKLMRDFVKKGVFQVTQKAMHVEDAFALRLYDKVMCIK